MGDNGGSNGGHSKPREEDDASQNRRDSEGLSGGNMGAGKSGREDMGSEKPQNDGGSNKPGQGAGGEDAVDDNPER